MAGMSIEEFENKCMDIIEQLLERINECNEKMKSEKNMATKMTYLDEIIQIAQITQQFHFIQHHSLLNYSSSNLRST